MNTPSAQALETIKREIEKESQDIKRHETELKNEEREVERAKAALKVAEDRYGATKAEIDRIRASQTTKHTEMESMQRALAEELKNIAKK